jgi:hypothetical protein
MDELESVRLEIGAQGPPPGLERRVVDDLKRRRLLGPKRPALAVFAGAALAGAALFFAGVFVGKSPASGAAKPGGQFLLLLREDSAFDRAEGAAHTARVEEYRRWAGEISRGGALVGGAELSPDSRDLPTRERGRAQADTIAGYFLIRARSLDAAVQLARGCPHLRHGGSIEVRPLRGRDG